MEKQKISLLNKNENNFYSYESLKGIAIKIFHKKIDKNYIEIKYFKIYIEEKNYIKEKKNKFFKFLAIKTIMNFY